MEPNDLNLRTREKLRISQDLNVGTMNLLRKLGGREVPDILELALFVETEG